MREITLSQDKVALVDDGDFEWLNGWKWHAYHGRRDTFYATRNSPRPRQQPRRPMIRMHRLIMDAPTGVLVDHRDGNGLNNQRSNLRLGTNAQNLRNRGAQSNNASGVKGVSWYAPTRKWKAKIGVNGKDIRLGHFATAAEAGAAYDRAAIKYHGEFALTNAAYDRAAMVRGVGAQQPNKVKVLTFGFTLDEYGRLGKKHMGGLGPKYSENFLSAIVTGAAATCVIHADLGVGTWERVSSSAPRANAPRDRVPVERLRLYGPTDDEERTMPLHYVPEHAATYEDRDGHRLFGRHHGTFAIPGHWKGNPEAGMSLENLPNQPSIYQTTNQQGENQP